MGENKVFTKEDDEVLREKWMSYCARDIGNILGRTKNSIIGRARRLGLPHKIDGSVRLSQTTHKLASPLMPTVPKAPCQFAFKTKKKKKLPFVPLSPSLQLDPPPTTAHNCTLLELGRTSCRWPIGHPLTSEFRYCGIPEADFPIVPYCPYHCKLGYSVK